MRNLVIVESPAKSKTVGRYLNAQSNQIESEKQEYEILATGGHILESDGIEVDNDFQLNYELIPKKQKNVLRHCRSNAQSAKTVPCNRP